MELIRALNGNKSYLAVIVWAGATFLVKMGWLDGATWGNIEPLVMGLGGVGVAHKLAKMKS
jgi:hypothetical protein